MNRPKAELSQQIRENRGEPLRRTATVRSVSEADRTAVLAFSSEAPVERWFGTEVLSHEPGAIRLDRLRDGGPLLMGHHRDVQVGVIEDVSIDPDRRGRAVVRFGRGAVASEVFRDVLDGIRRHVSVGYQIHEMRIEKREGEPDLVTATDWEPYEVSLVSVPADTTVGVDRGRDAPEAAAGDDPHDEGAGAPAPDKRGGRPVTTKVLRNEAGHLVRAKVDDDGKIIEEIEVIERAGDAERRAAAKAVEAVEDEKARVRELLRMGEQYGVEDLAREHVSQGKTVADLQRAALDRLSAAPEGKPVSAEGSSIGLTEAEARQFSFLRLLRALAHPQDRRAQQAAGFEFEACAAAAERSAREPQGHMIPEDVLAVPVGETRTFNTGTSGATMGDTGGYSIATNLLTGSFIDMLRNNSVVMQRARPLSGLVGNVDIPKEIAAGQMGWIGEDEEAPKSGPELGQISLTPKTGAIFYDITRKLMLQSSMDIEAFVRASMAKSMALGIDKAALYGTGTDYQPLGLLNTLGVNAIQFEGQHPTYAELVDMETEIADGNASIDSIMWLMTPRGRGAAKKAPMLASVDIPLWEPGGTLIGYPVEISKQVDEGTVILGDYSELFVGTWGGLDIIVDPFTESRRGRTRITMFRDVDFRVRREESFCVGRAAAQP